MNIFRKILVYFILLTTLSIVGYTLFIYNFTLSDGVRSGILSKFSHKGVIFKTWEGELNEGFGATRFFPFSVQDNEEKVIADLKKYQGQYVKLEYKERMKTLPWWGDTNYFIISVTPEKSPYVNSK
jgi:hypothetical protein